ncbi:hypothetical protein WA026_021797 [Henosepilachna vigintioctopunctata]|uniref:Cytochrome P450 n=1 Tax=Henosepilachna vigintioctopunctata TaxID=420089 RepID=A0AAW1TZJ4_9CUCU
MIEQQVQTPTSDDSRLFLLKIVACLLCIVIGKFYWDRRKFYLLSAKLPGPSGYPFLGSSLDFFGGTEAIFKAFSGYPKMYSDVHKLWIGPKFFVVISNPEWLEIILNSSKALEKGDVYEFTKPFLGNGLLSAPVHIWKKHRKLMNPTFSQKILESYMPIFSEQAKILVDILCSENDGKSFDIFPRMSSCLVDTICETAMGIKVDTQRTNNNFGKLLDRMMEMYFIRLATPIYYNEYFYSFTEHWKSGHEICDTLKNFAETVISNKRLSFEQDGKLKKGASVNGKRKFESFLDLFIQLSDEKGSLSDEELKDEVYTIMTAGSDTTATSTSFCLLILGMYPEVQAKVYEELMDVLGEDSDVTWKDLTCLKYMDRVIKECLRIFTPAPLISRRTTGEINIEGINMPPNTNFIVNYLHLHRNPKYWKDPLKFDPDRFLPEEVAKRHPYSYLLFSGGPRSCIGSKFAEMNMKTLLSVILRKFEVKAEYKSIEEIELKINLS